MRQGAYSWEGGTGCRGLTLSWPQGSGRGLGVPTWEARGCFLMGPGD